jgi:hypothetical protein
MTDKDRQTLTDAIEEAVDRAKAELVPLAVGRYARQDLETVLSISVKIEPAENKAEITSDGAVKQIQKYKLETGRETVDFRQLKLAGVGE